MHKALILLFFVFVVLSSSAFSASFKLSEQSLEEAAKKGSPQLDQIESAFLNASFKQGETQQGYSPELFGRGSYSETNERALIEFQPIFSPIKQMQLGVRQNFTNGLDTSAYVVTDQRSATVPFAGKLRDATTSTLAFTVQMDIWKNLFGRNSKAEVETAGFEKKRAAIEKDIQTKTFKIALRRLYWSLVANKEALNISEELLKTAQTQLSETNRRFQNAVAEADEVARYEAQAASRQGTILYLKYQKETFLKQLKNLLPELAKFEIELDEYDLNQTMTEVLACTATIAQNPRVPFDYTQYDEAVALLRKIRTNNSMINSRYADADVKLFGTVKATGVGSEETDNGYRGSYRQSFDDIHSTNRTGYEVGVSFTLPLGDVKEGTQKIKELYDEKRLLASINNTDAQVVTTHQQLVKSIGLLTDVISSQRITSSQLGKRLKLVRKKYEQARVSVNDLVNDQDALLNSELTTIDTQLQILNTLFDYLVVFTETPCPFNRI
jgi:outer membrane protein TolC